MFKKKSIFWNPNMRLHPQIKNLQFVESIKIMYAKIKTIIELTIHYQADYRFQDKRCKMVE